MAGRTVPAIFSAVCLAGALLASSCGFVIGTKPNGAGSIPYENPISLPRDAAGWTVFTPSADTRIAYVSAAGDDGTAAAYAAGEPAVGPDPFHPSGAILPFRTFAAAREAVRNGFPDWILFKRGETFESVSIELLSGRSAAEFSLVSSYGDDGLALPELRPSGDAPVIAGYARDPLQYAAVTNLYCFSAAHHTEPGSGVLPPQGGSGMNLLTGGGIIRSILIEGVRLESFAGNVIQTYGAGSIIRGITVRRCVILDNFSTLRTNGHSQGIFVGGVSGLFIEECVFDHNGWCNGDNGSPEEVAGEATMFNHNTYIADSGDITLRNNIFLRSSSINNKFTGNNGPASAVNIAVQGNLYVDGEIGISIGGNEDIPYKFKDIRITGNVFTETGRSRPTDRTLGWGLDIADWDGGEASGNYFIHNTTPEVDNTYGIHIDGGTRDVLVSDNVIYGLNETGTGAWGYALAIGGRDVKENITISGNVFQEPFGPYFMIGLEDPEDAAGFSFYGNRYCIPQNSTDRAFLLGGAPASPGRWHKATGDRSGFTAVPFPDPSRSIAGYQASIGEPAAMDDFIAACRAQGRDAWDARYTAQAVTAWLKAGFAH